MTLPPDPTRGYERHAAAFLAGRNRPGAAIGAAEVRAWARDLPRDAAVLDVACGSGVPITRALVEEGHQVFALDASSAMVAAFRANFPRIPVACEPVETTAFFDRTFDGIVAWGLVFLLPEEAQRVAIRRMASALGPEGRLLFTAPAPACAWMDAVTGEPSRSLGAAAYRDLLHAEGLAVVGEYEDEGQNYYFDAVRRRGTGRFSRPAEALP
ncbi:MAG: class I SAM-dependent methyltransferase [Gemmatimonadetes bacterium]|nr:class I SAM-dependent methyltransferase [Gemmatimonadota bacterium]MBK9065849.1 class I SAM-dependent methyltransferase [Gemmatimonadota bacterium]